MSTPILTSKPFSDIEIGDPVIISDRAFARVTRIDVLNPGENYRVTLETGYRYEGKRNWFLTVVNPEVCDHTQQVPVNQTTLSVDA